MGCRRLQFFFGALAFFLAARSPYVLAETYAVTFVDVDGNKFSTASGQLNIIVVASSADVERARSVGDRVPDFCLANPEYRLITLLRFEKKHHAPMRAIINAVVRKRLASEAQRLRLRYSAKGITRDPRKDLFAVTDFDGGIGSQFGIPAGSTAFQVLVLCRKGELIQRWTDVPTADALAAVVK